MASRWAEDWTGRGDAGAAPALKDLRLGTARITLNTEVRLRQTAFDNARLTPESDPKQAQLRAVLGANVRLNQHLRLYGEIGTGQVGESRAASSPNFQNEFALQQLFADARGEIGPALVGVMVGRQEFSDGPRQLISLSDGPNLHRTWNGFRVYAHGSHFRLGAFDLRGTRLGHGGFDESVNRSEKLQGVNASFIVSSGDGHNTYLEPFWLLTENPAVRVGGQLGSDDRDTLGMRLWGRNGRLRYDWTAARQKGSTAGDRPVDAWAVLAVQSLDLATAKWKPKLTSRIDIASGSRSFHSGASGTFNPLYASSNYVGEGQFLGLSNVVMVSPGVALSPTPRTTLSIEHGLAWRFRETDAIYSSGMRAYAGTETVRGSRIGSLSRLTATMSASTRVSFRLNVEHLHAADALHLAGFESGSFVYLDATYRF